MQTITQPARNLLITSVPQNRFCSGTRNRPGPLEPSPLSLHFTFCSRSRNGFWEVPRPVPGMSSATRETGLRLALLVAGRMSGCLYSIPHARTLTFLLELDPRASLGSVAQPLSALAHGNLFRPMDKIGFVEIWANQGAVPRLRANRVQSRAASVNRLRAAWDPR
jgi:hypothetical protein